MAKKVARTIKVLFKLVLGLLFFVLVLGFGVFVYFAKDLPDPEVVVAQEPVQSTKIFARDGKTLLYEISGGKRRTVVSLDQISPMLIKATLATEDARFYQHMGVDPLALLRAAYQNFQARDFVQGGSTITQQFVKNAMLSGKRSLARKIKEIILALELERRYSKDKILEFYLNTIPYGSNAYGVEAAAQTFFGKHASELNLAEAATLAAIPKAPSYYSPFGSHLDALEARRNFVLQRMVGEGFISPAEAKAAQKVAIKDIINKHPQEASLKAPHFVMYVRELLEEKFGPEVLQKQGLRVVTTLDWDLQKKAEEMVADWVDDIKKRFFASNAALVALDPQTGQILAMVGSADFWDFKNDGQVNVALRPRQPGSAFKPFVYATAFKKGYRPDTIIFDLPTQFPGAPKDWPQNYTGTFQGPMSMRQALAQSVNLVAVKTLYLVGVPAAIETAKQMGITTLKDPGRYGLSLVLGSGEVKLLELASAYGAFATDGVRYPPTPFLKITNAAGEVIEQYSPKPERVLDPQVARLINDVLSDNEARAPLFGLHSPLYFPDREVAVKTGTTDNFKDAWTVGYSRNLVVGVWAGNNDGSPMRKAAGGYAVAPLWHNFFAWAVEKLNLPNQPFAPPAPPDQDAWNVPMVNGQFASQKTVKIDAITGKLATQYTPPELVKEVSFKEVHNILHYVRPNDPLYENWEKPVQEWLKHQPDSAGFNQKPPTDKDDVHLPENRPQILIISPQPQAQVNKNTLINFRVQAEGKFKLQQVDFYANDFLIGSDFKAPFEISFRLSDLPELPTSSKVALKAKVFDEFLNSNQDSLEINLVSDSQPPKTD